MEPRQRTKHLWDNGLAACGIALLPVGLSCSVWGPAWSGIPAFAASLALGVGNYRVRRGSRKDSGTSDLLTMFNATNSIVIVTDATGTITRFNSAAERSLGYCASEVIGLKSPESFHLPKEFTPAEGFLGALYQPIGAEGAGSERTFIRKDGSTFTVILTYNSLTDEAGKVTGYFAIGVDISLRKSEESAILDKQELIESIAVTSPTIFYIFDLVDRSIVYCNRDLAVYLGYSEEDAIRMGPDPLPSLIHPEDLEILFNRYVNCSQLRDGEVIEVEFRCITADGSLRWLSARDVIFKKDAEGNPLQILVNVFDITVHKMLVEQVECQLLEIQDTNFALEIQTNALEEANTTLESLAFTDGLTGIANHRSFQEELAKSFELAKKRKARLSLMLIDVDRFKQYNDTYGHPSGDIVLKRVATVIRDSCPKECTPARYGGEEFAVVCPDFSPNEILILAEKIRAAVETTPWPEQGVTISIGAISLAPEMSTTSDLVTAADSALYSSKASGRNCVTYYDHTTRRKLAS